MRTELPSWVDPILGAIPRKTSRSDTAARMMIDADFILRRELKPPAPPQEPWVYPHLF